MIESRAKPRLALDTYVLAQGVKTGIYRVCAELYPRLAEFAEFDVSLFRRSPATDSFGIRAAEYAAPAAVDQHAADILLSPFGVAPVDWLQDPRLIHAHFIYDLIAIEHPEYFDEIAAREVRQIIDSLDVNTAIFVISESTRRDLLRHRPDLDPAQVTVVPLAAGQSFSRCMDEKVRLSVRQKYGIPAQVPYMLSLATLEVRKNLESVVEAFRRYLEANAESELHLVLSGMSGWKLEQLNAALESASKWRHRIVLTGFVDDQDLSPLYSDAHCFIYLSRYEGFGLPPLEAMACGAAVICSNNSSLPEVVGDAGILVDADDVNEAADAVRRVCESAELRTRLSESALQRAQEFSWDRCAELVAQGLMAAWVRHCERATRVGERPLLPGELARRYTNRDGTPGANFLFYADGARGQRFPAMRRGSPTLRCDATSAWPVWRDTLPPGLGGRTEGGKRINGSLKTGSRENPLVSYVTVVRNNESTLARAIESVQTQTYPNVEHIVLDGASTDRTLDVILKYGDGLDYFASEPDAGLYQAINKALQLARGDLICILNSDDWLEPRAAEIAVHRLRGREGAALLLSGAFARSGATSADWPPSFVHPGCYFICANDCHNAIYATREAYAASGPYDEAFKIAADFKWIMSCLDAGADMFYTRQATVNYSMGGTSGDVRRHSEECMRVVAQRFPFLGPEEVEGLYHCFFFGPVEGLVDSLPDKRRFVQDLFVRHGENDDFATALSWAMMQKPAVLDDAASAASKPPVEATAPSGSVLPGSKELAKAVLARHPAAYKVAQRIYATLRKA